jgi:hypothetical protein
MMEDWPMAWSSVGIINKAINTGILKRIDPVVRHLPDGLVHNVSDLSVHSCNMGSTTGSGMYTSAASSVRV